MRVIERATSIEDLGAGIQVGPNGVKALDWLGVWGNLHDSVWRPGNLVVHDGITGETLRVFPFELQFERRFAAPYRVLHRGDLLAALLAAANASENITIVTGTEVTGVKVAAERTPRVLVKGGLPLDADAVIGADGIRSAVRASLIGDGPPTSRGHVIYRSLLSRGDVPSFSGDVGLWMFPNGHVVHYPVRGGTLLNIVAVTQGDTATDDWNAPAGRDEVARAFAGVAAPLISLLAAPSAWGKWRAADRPPLAAPGRGSVTLAGDAAHPILPYLAQGGVAALEDAVTIGRELRNTPEPGPAFRAYESLRRQRTARLQRESAKQGEICHASGIKAALRNFYLRVVPEPLFFRRTAWIYGWKP